MDDHTSTANAFQAGKARFRRLFERAGMRHVQTRAMAALGLAASVWGACHQTAEHLLGIVETAFHHAVREVRRRSVVRGRPDISVDARLVRHMQHLVQRELGEAPGRFHALMLATLAIEDLWALCELCAEGAERAAHAALDFVTNRDATEACAVLHGGFATHGGTS